MPLSQRIAASLIAAAAVGVCGCRPARLPGEAGVMAAATANVRDEHSAVDDLAVVTLDGREFTLLEIERRIGASSWLTDQYFAFEQRRSAWVQGLVYTEVGAAEAARLGLVDGAIERVMTHDAAGRSALTALAAQRVIAGGDEFDAALERVFDAERGTIERGASRRVAAIVFDNELAARRAREAIVSDQAYDSTTRATVFDSWARRLNVDEALRATGGDLGFFVQSEADADARAIAEVAFGLTANGAVSEPVRTRGGWALFAVSVEVAATDVEPDELRAILRPRVLAEQRAIASRTAIDGARATVGVQIDASAVAALSQARQTRGIEPAEEVRPRRYSADALAGLPSQTLGASWRSVEPWYRPPASRTLADAVVPVTGPLIDEGSGESP